MPAQMRDEEVFKPTAQPEFMAEHTVTNDDTLSALALHFYGSAEREKWMLIYEANKDVIGDNPAILRPGIVLKIPKLA